MLIKICINNNDSVNHTLYFNAQEISLDNNF